MGKDYRVVIVDDVKAIANSIKRELMLAGRRNHINFLVEDFQDPVDSIDSIVKSPPDLLISDIKMPYMTGDQLIVEIKKRMPQLPVLVITGFATKDAIYNIMKVDDRTVVLAKPWDEKKLIEAVAKLLDIELDAPEPAKK
jgi:DNA-binding NtrC family response regulator